MESQVFPEGQVLPFRENSLPPSRSLPHASCATDGESRLVRPIRVLLVDRSDDFATAVTHWLGADPLFVVDGAVRTGGGMGVDG